MDKRREHRGIVERSIDKKYNGVYTNISKLKFLKIDIMLNIRLSRVGKRGHAQYKIVVAEKTAPVKGKFVEQVGSYDPHTKELRVKKDRVDYWISNGAACSATVQNLFVEKKIIEGDKVKLTFKKKTAGAEDEKEEDKKEVEGKTEKETGEAEAVEEASTEKKEEGSDKEEAKDKSTEKVPAEKKE
jgi:small subunit ribosomal protein S16